MLYSQAIKNLIAGVSQQPPLLRMPEQLEEQINGFSTESAGLQKRPPTLHIKTLTNIPMGDKAEPLIHFINRDSFEKYMMVFNNDTIYITDLEGNTKQLTFDENINADYLKTDVPRRDLRILTVADYTFILNKKITVRMTEKQAPDYFKEQGVLVHVKSGQYGRTYSVWTDAGHVASYTTPNGSDASHTTSIDTANIVAQLANQIRAKGITVDTGDCWLRIQGATSISTQDGYNNQAMIGIKDTVQRFTLLPATAPDGYCVKVKGDPNGNDAGGYYVRYNAAERVWGECCEPNIPIEIDAMTMPHAITRNADGSFTFKALKWDEREIGDDDSNPLPSFIGQTISDIFFFRNRLGVTSGENVVLSESGSFFNFWMTTANDLLDTDCIDIPTTSTKVSILNYAVPFNEDLYLFSNESQFVLRVDTTLSPKNVALPEVTSFTNNPGCRPAVAGKNLYFTAERSEFTTVKEFYTVQDVSEIKNAQDITSHIPSYIPNGVYQILVNTSENMLMFLTTGDLKSIYLYKYLFINEQRLQAAWSKWTFNTNIYGGCFIGSMLYLVLKRGETLVLETINFTYETTDYEAEPYRCYLDRKKITVTAQYDSITERTMFNLCEEYNTADTKGFTTVALVASNGLYFEITDIPSNGTIYIEGNHINEEFILGIPYLFKVELSTFYIKKQDNNGGIQSLTNGRLQLRRLKVHYSNTGTFIIKVYLPSGKVYSYEMTARTLGKASATLNKLTRDTGTASFPLHTLNTQCKITIESTAPLPVAIIGLQWEGNFIQKTRGV